MFNKMIVRKNFLKSSWDTISVCHLIGKSFSLKTVFQSDTYDLVYIQYDR